MRVPDMTHPDDGLVSDDSRRESEELAFVRHQLDRLADARSISVLAPRDTVRYLELCEKERWLLERRRREGLVGRERGPGGLRVATTKVPPHTRSVLHHCFVTRPSPSASRALAILDFLAAHPTESFTLSELARELEINVASTHAVLGAMTEAGYLVRHPSHKTYRLGPSTMAIGHAALVSHPVIGVARDQMQMLAEETGLECLAAAPFEMELVAVARFGPSSGHTPLIEVGQRLPLVPPLGTMYLAWSSPERIEAWLRRAPDHSKQTTRHYRNVLESARTLGYSVGLSVEGKQAAIGSVEGDPAVLDIEPARHHRVSYIAASTFDERGDVSLVLALGAFGEPLTVEEIESFAHRLRDTAVLITAKVHGKQPDGRNRPV